MHKSQSYQSVNRNIYGVIQCLKPQLKGKSKAVLKMKTIYSYATSAHLYFLNLWLQDVLVPFTTISLRSQCQKYFPWKIYAEKQYLINFLNLVINSMKQNNNTQPSLIPQQIYSYFLKSYKFASLFQNLNENSTTIEVPINDKIKIKLSLSVIKFESKFYCPHCSSAYGFMVCCHNCEQWVHPQQKCENDRRNPETLKKKM